MCDTRPVGPSRAPQGASRRTFLGRSAAIGGLALAASPAWLAELLAQAGACAAEAPAGELVRLLPLYGPGSADVPLGSLVGGSGLDARQFTDLTTLDAGAMVTPTAEVFVRTAVPPGLVLDPATWTVTLRDLSGAAQATVTAAAIAHEAVAQGEHLIECAGNSNPQNFGLMSAVRWDGVPLARVLARVTRPAGATGLLVSGRDHGVQESRQSLPGASWVLPLEAIERGGAFLAVGMNSAPLTPNHGAPVRLVVPGWYGCAWIKWVDALQWVDADAPCTTQMLEFAFRTHQAGIPPLARDYEAPAIDTTAMPIRVEQRRVNGRLEYRIVGLVWGGDRPVDRLEIRFGSRDRGTPLRVCPAPATSRTWALWTHRWQPEAPGYYDITLKAADPGVRTRRLDLSFYIRRVKIDEI